MVLYNSLLDGLQNLLYEVHLEEQPPQLSFKKWCKRHPKWGSRDRKLVGKALFDSLRWKRRYCWCMNTESLNRENLTELLWVWSVLEDISWKTPPKGKFPSASEIKARDKNGKKHPKIAHAIPDWLDALGSTHYPETWQEECAAFNTPAPLILRVNTLKTSKTALQQQLEKEGIVTTPIAHYPYALKCEQNARVTSTKAYQKGFFEIQDANSQKVAEWIAPEKGHVIFDVCAGAGGKTLHLATQLQNTGQVFAMDANPKKLEVLQERAMRNGLENIVVPQEIDNAFQAQWQKQVDAVLIDSPCSGLGVLRRHPEHKWIMHPQRIKALNEVQEHLLQTHSNWVKPKGHLCYATCSILPSENEHQIDRFLQSNTGQQFKLIKAETMLTHTTGNDGFFIAKMQRQ